jgi:hypothetical protein
MIHPDTSIIEISPTVGLGVAATGRIPKGTLVWVQDRFDRVVARDEGLILDAEHRAVLDRYAHLDRHGNWILCWDAGRLVNHACDPALRGLGPNVMVARRDLEPGDEITCDYAECNIEWSLECSCKSSTCRGSIHARDLLRFASAWDEEARLLALDARSVAQPLLSFAVDRDDVTAFIAGARAIPSFAVQSPLHDQHGST